MLSYLSCLGAKYHNNNGEKNLLIFKKSFKKPLTKAIYYDSIEKLVDRATAFLRFYAV